MRVRDSENSRPEILLWPKAPQEPVAHEMSPGLAEAEQSFDYQAVQTQRLDALAQMAGHVAHEYNNLLTTILGFSGLMRQATHLSEDERDNLRHIDDAAHRAAELTQSLLAFARGGLVSYGTLDVNRIVEETLSLAEPTLGQLVHVHLDAPRCGPFIDGDAGQIQQAILNILFNARDALDGDGDVYVTVREISGEVQLVVRDTGPGMDAETRRRAFEPFFTRKSPGSRAGLGLSTTYGIVKGHRGSIDVDSAPGSGTTVTMTFPVSETPKSTRERTHDGDLALIATAADDATRTRATRLATALGLTPIFARDTAHAIELISSRPHRFATAIGSGDSADSTDIRAILETHPTLPLLLCTPTNA